ncbi:DinB family protein [Kocuria palustris]|uniref:DinB family protein n=1 Tax=Kocuria palustris TaxID=71999 RepID=UPI0011A0A8DB|nr:DinB family protein [Kocuria palustris]
MTTHRTTPTPPDEVDWAFVTDEPCEACGFAPGRHELPPAEALRASAASWQGVISRDDVRERPSPEVWSPLEYAAHTRDVVDLFRERIRLLLDQDDPQFGSWDGEQVAVESDYAAQDPAAVAAEYAQSADLGADLLDGLDERQLARTGSRADGRAFTVAALIDYLLHEVRHHLQDAGAEAPQAGVEEAAAEAAEQTHDENREAADERTDA